MLGRKTLDTYHVHEGVDVAWAAAEQLATPCTSDCSLSYGHRVA